METKVFARFFCLGDDTPRVVNADLRQRPEECVAVALIAPNAETRYRVTETLVADPAQLSVLDATSTPTLTLVTCYPFRFLGPAPKQFVVKAQNSALRRLHGRDQYAGLAVLGP